MIVDMEETSMNSVNLQSHQIQWVRPLLIGLKTLQLIPAIHLISKEKDVANLQNVWGYFCGCL